MPLNKLAVLALLATLAIGTVTVFADDLPAVDPGIAKMTVDQKVAARQAAMKADNKVLRGAAKASGDAAVKIATSVLQNLVDFPALFADGATNSSSEALPAVWTSFDDFTGIFKKAQADTQAMIVAAKSGDKAAYSDALNALGQTCFDCHQTYRK